MGTGPQVPSPKGPYHIGELVSSAVNEFFQGLPNVAKEGDLFV